MDDMRFADIMQRERERLGREREEILNQQKDLENQLNEINCELAAVNAYESVKTGKAVTPTRRARSASKNEASITQSSAEPRPRPQAGTRRDVLVQVIGEQPNGLSRGEIFERMGRVARRAGKYVIGG